LEQIDSSKGGDHLPVNGVVVRVLSQTNVGRWCE